MDILSRGRHVRDPGTHPNLKNIGSGGFRVPGKLGRSGFRVPDRNPKSGFQWVPGSDQNFFVPTPDVEC